MSIGSFLGPKVVVSEHLPKRETAMWEAFDRSLLRRLLDGSFVDVRFEEESMAYRLPDGTWLVPPDAYNQLQKSPRDEDDEQAYADAQDSVREHGTYLDHFGDMP